MTLLYPLRAGETSPVTAVNASSDIAGLAIRLTLANGETATLSEE